MSASITPSAPTTRGVSRRAGRRIGYVATILVNLVIFGVINVWPGWEAAGFVTPAAAEVVPLINLSIGVAIVVNAVYLVADGTRIKALGELVNSAIVIVVSIAVLDVFPFDFSGYAFPWEWLVVFVLVVAMIGSGVSILVNLWRLIRGPRAPLQPSG